MKIELTEEELTIVIMALGFYGNLYWKKPYYNEVNGIWKKLVKVYEAREREANED